MKSNRFACFFISLRFFEMTTSWAPSRFASRGLVRSGREHHHVRAESVGQLDRHVPQSPETDHADRVPLPDLPVAQRGVRRDARAKKRGYRGEVAPCAAYPTVLIMSLPTFPCG